MPVISAGDFTVYSGMLFVNGVEQSGAQGFRSFMQFGDTAGANTLRMDAGLMVVGHYPGAPGALIDFADFCCQFSQPFNPGNENGQAVFDGDDFRALYLPTGQTNRNVTAFGSGVWTARPIPEPASLALLVVGVIILGACSPVLGRRRMGTAGPPRGAR